MVGNMGTLMPVRFVHSKLRKRDEFPVTSPTMLEVPTPPLHVNFGPNRSSNLPDTSNENHQHPDQQQAIFVNQSLSNHHATDRNGTNVRCVEQQHVTFVRTNVVEHHLATSNSSSNWVFPPKVPTPNVYNCLNSDMMETINDRNGFKGFRKQFSGRFKRLVTKKTEPVPAIPPELKPQLKTIYVY